MSKDLTKMNLISIVQQLPEEDIEFVQTYIKMIEQENKLLQEKINKLKLVQCRGEFSCLRNKVRLSEYSQAVLDYKKLFNILFELEKWLKDYSSMLIVMPDIQELAQLDLIEEILNKLQELKGSDNNE